MSIKLIVKIIIVSAVLTLYKMIHSVSYLVYNSLAMEQMQNSADTYIEMQAYTYILNYSWIVVAIIILLMFCEDIIKLIKIIKEKINE